MEDQVNAATSRVLPNAWRWMTALCALIFMLAGLATTPAALAKRAAPAPVAAVVIGSVEFTAPATAMGFVVATDKSTRRELWRQRIYEVLQNPAMESDVQDVFINALEVDNGLLLIRNERGTRFLLDPATRAVTKLP